MSGRHRKPTTSAVNVAKIAFTGAVLGTGSIALAGQAAAATDGEWDHGRALRIWRQLGHQHRQRIPGRAAVLARDLVLARWRRVRPRRAHGLQGRADRRRRARAGHSGPRRLAGVRHRPVGLDATQRARGCASAPGQPRRERSAAASAAVRTRRGRRPAARRPDGSPATARRHRAAGRPAARRAAASSPACTRSASAAGRPGRAARCAPSRRRRLDPGRRSRARSGRASARRTGPDAPPVIQAGNDAPAPDAPAPDAPPVIEAGNDAPAPAPDAPAPAVEAAAWDVVQGGPAPADQPQAWALHAGDLPLDPVLAPGPLPGPPAPDAPPAPAPDQAPAPDPLAPLNAVNIPAPAYDAANQAVSGTLPTPPDGMPHLASPDAPPPGSTMDPSAAGDDSPNVSYLKDLWQAVQDHDISGKEALVMGLAQRGMNTPYPDQAPGPNVPLAPADPAAPPPPDAGLPPAPAPGDRHHCRCCHRLPASSQPAVRRIRPTLRCRRRRTGASTPVAAPSPCPPAGRTFRTLPACGRPRRRPPARRRRCAAFRPGG